MADRCVIIPSIAASMMPDSEITLSFAKLSWGEFKELVTGCKKIINYIRHKPTNDLLASIAVFETGFEYKISMGDLIFVVGLKSRAPVSGADVTVTPNDLLIYLAKPVK